MPGVSDDDVAGGTKKGMPTEVGIPF